MTEKGDDHHPHQSYIITFDLAEKVQLFRTIGLKVPDPNDPFFLKTREQTIKLFEEILPGVEIRGINMSDLASDIISAAMALKTSRLQDAIIVSTCPEITSLRSGASFSLHINRIVDGDGNILGIGPRPGTESIDSQINALAAYAKGHQVILVEDGSFTGKTLVYVLNMLQKRGIRVSAVVIGFVFQKAKDIISKDFSGEVIDIESVDGLVDWMPDHDFYPMIPNSGRVIGIRWKEDVLPMYSDSGMTFCVPYLEYFCPITDWASIPEEHKWKISRFFICKAYDLFVKIHHLNDRNDITIGELTGVLPRVSAPVHLRDGRLMSADTKVLEYLHGLVSED